MSYIPAFGTSLLSTIIASTSLLTVKYADVGCKFFGLNSYNQ